MADRMDVLTPEESNGKTYWYRIGVAFPAKEGEGWTIKLAATPVNGKLVLRPPFEKREGGKEGGWGNNG